MIQSLNFLCLKILCRCQVMITTQLYKSAEGGNLRLHRAFDCSCNVEAKVTHLGIFIVLRLPCLKNDLDKVERPDGRANLSFKLDVITLLNFKMF